MHTFCKQVRKDGTQLLQAYQIVLSYGILIGCFAETSQCPVKHSYIAYNTQNYKIIQTRN